MTKDITRGSGNVFADLGFENPSEHQAKADLALQIVKAINNRKLTQKDAARPAQRLHPRQAFWVSFEIRPEHTDPRGQNTR